MVDDPKDLKTLGDFWAQLPKANKVAVLGTSLPPIRLGERPELVFVTFV
jgi:hypothetical protein